MDAEITAVRSALRAWGKTQPEEIRSLAHIIWINLHEVTKPKDEWMQRAAFDMLVQNVEKLKELRRA